MRRKKSNEKDINEGKIILTKNYFRERYGNPNTVKKISLTNVLYEIDKDAFEELTSLEYLSLFYNQIPHLHKDTFKKLYNLKCLCLEENGITSLDKDIFKDLKSLEVLFMHEHKISFLHKDTLKPLTSLKITSMPLDETSSQRKFVLKFIYACLCICCIFSIYFYLKIIYIIY
jgi:Leucine-rich repeat (LRR) protein